MSDHLDGEPQDGAALLRAAMDRIEQLEARIAALEPRGLQQASDGDRRSRQMADHDLALAPPTTENELESTDGEAQMGRRQALRGALFAAGAAAAAAVLSDADPAAAADGNALILGVSNASTNPTFLTNSGASTSDDALALDSAYGCAIRATSHGQIDAASFEATGTGASGVYVKSLNGEPAIYAISSTAGIYGTATSSGDGVHGSSSSGTGVYGSSSSSRGVTGVGADGIYGTSSTTYGNGVFGKGTGSSGTGVRGEGRYGIIGLTTVAGGVGMSANSTTGYGLEAVSSGGTGVKSTGHVFGVIAQSLSTSATDAALAASSTKAMGIQVTTDSGQVMTGKSDTGGGIGIDAPKFHVRMANASATRSAPTSDAFAHQAGEIVYTTAGDTWFCVKGGTPGMWRKVAGQATAGSFHVLATPARMYDSRTGSSPSQGPKTTLTGNIARTLDCTVNSSGVPKGATAVALTVLLVNAANTNGNLTVWANGAAKPTANTIVWGAGSGRYTTSTITAVDANAKLQVASSASTDLVLDIVGYYR